jgi:hypothetical protein
MSGCGIQGDCLHIRLQGVHGRGDPRSTRRSRIVDPRVGGARRGGCVDGMAGRNRSPRSNSHHANASAKCRTTGSHAPRRNSRGRGEPGVGPLGGVGVASRSGADSSKCSAAIEPRIGGGACGTREPALVGDVETPAGRTPRGCRDGTHRSDRTRLRASPEHSIRWRNVE